MPGLLNQYPEKYHKYVETIANSIYTTYGAKLSDLSMKL